MSMHPIPSPSSAEGADLREQISALMDGELAEERDGCLDRLCRDEAARREWALWHAAGDALRSSEVAVLHSTGFSARLAQRLADEPAIVAPGALRGGRRLVRRVVLPGAAAAAAVAVLTFGALPMLRESERAQVEVAYVQGASQPAAPMVPVVASVARSTPSRVVRQVSVADADGFEAYLSAHSQMSGTLGLPRTSPYLRQGSSLQNVSFDR
jgi:sigma-E factor negative regulatory protein RseA